MLVVSRTISSPISTNAISYLCYQSEVNKTCCVLFKQTLEIVRVWVANLELELYFYLYNMISYTLWYQNWLKLSRLNQLRLLIKLGYPRLYQKSLTWCMYYTLLCRRSLIRDCITQFLIWQSSTQQFFLRIES